MQNNQQPAEEQDNQQVNSTKQKHVGRRIAIAFASSIFAALMLAPLVGRFYSWAFKVYCGGGLFLLEGIDPNCSFDGFIFSYVFLLALALVLSRAKIKTIIISWFLGVLLFLLLFIGEWKFFFAIILLGSLGYFLGKLILKLKRR